MLLLLVPNSGQAKGYSQQELLTWLQRSNFGYQVLQQAQNESLLSPQSAKSDALCVAQVRLLLKAAETRALPALKGKCRVAIAVMSQAHQIHNTVLDAWGKFPHGLLYGHFSDMGNYDACLKVPQEQGDGSSMTRGKYCLARIQFESLLPQAMETLNVQIGTCIPATCRATLLNRWLSEYLKELFGDADAMPQTAMVVEQNCSLDQRDPLSGLDWFAIVILTFNLCSLLAAFNNKLLLVFSLRQNLRSLMKITSSTAVGSHVIPCLHGIRCLTIIWIIYGHDNMFMLLSPTVNNYEVVAWAQTPYSMILQSGSISVDTFFLLSGMLLVMATLRELERQSGKLNVPLMYLHRIVRLTPVLAVAVLFFMTLFPRLDDGPVWNQFTSSSQLCSDTWWATILYVQNYAAAGRMCLGHSWYLAVDMQLFLLSPLLLWPLWRWRRRAAVAIMLLVVLLFACVFCIIMINELQVFNRNGNLGEDSPQMRLIYYTTHARATPWLIGLLFGYFLHNEKGRRRGMPWWLVLLLWLLSMTMLCLVIWIIYPFTQPTADEITPLAGAFYICCSRIVWPVALCWLIWACHNGLGGVVNTLLSWSFWQPISKLSYCLYIWHLLVETLNTARMRTSQHFSNYDAILRFWSDFGITVLVAMFMFLCIETPFVRLEMQLLATLRARQKPPTAATNTPTVTLSVIATPPSVSQQNLVEA
ncbi:hypothetical protein KR093_002452 [Drosophila rubida]|uniref:Nose resistant-to-fluoxetine protein N-terminal domain-containing protein n=1 Tax=Drosophila rubida TaxID=30044 RepID=A0AAD4K9I2_9MUSC|nr:hypothetical protein KR093_002452 [Drosophila rubida]